MGLLRLLYGLSGAVLGLLFGVCVVVRLTISVRLVGTLAEGRLAGGEPPAGGREQRRELAPWRPRSCHAQAWKKELEAGGYWAHRESG